MDNKRIRDFVLEDHVTGFFSVRRKVVREFTRGKFITLELGDSSGRIAGVIWSPDQFSLVELAEGMVVKMQGVVGEYNNKLQLSVERIRLAEDDEYTLEDIMPHSAQSLEQRRARILALADRIENNYIKSLTDSFLKDEEYLDAFLHAAAGKLWHHACIGGLAEHSANVAELALGVAANYDFLNKDYLIFGGLFHDAGKIAQYSTDIVIDYTTEGRLVGHICIVDRWISERAAKIESFPDSLLTELRHIILSHHGELEYASPVVPQMPEAFVLYYCDEIDSKMGAIDRIRERQGETGWSEYVKLLNRYLYFGDTPEE
ncbi:MAG: HD domain-containing protein [candidate division Zixibacteria bacterium]|nr:HD domain-containing protein [candidate division Zixibacteria bacterium]